MSASRDLFDVKGLTVVVTGGGSGIGRMIAEGFAKGGSQVYISSRKYNKCKAAAQDITERFKGTCVALPPVNLGGGEASCLTFVENLEKAGVKSVDVLVNNSGCSWGEPLEKYSEKGFDKVMNLNVKGLFFLTKSMVPLLSAGASASNPSRVINIGSIAGIKPQKVPTYAYDASKSAVHHLTRHLAGVLSDKNITVNAIAPGIVPTKMSKGLTVYVDQDKLKSSIPLARFGKPQDMAAAAIFLAAKSGSWITGIVLPVDGGSLVSRL